LEISQATVVKWGQLRQAEFAVPQRLIALAYVLLTAIALYPIFSVAVPPLVDYPVHLARLHVLTAIDKVPLLSERYAVDWNILPNLAMDIVVFGLAKFLPVADALRLFVASSLILIIAGTLALHRVLYGRIGLIPGVVFLMLYNHILIFGFINYLFGVGLYLLAFAGWIATPRWPAWRRLLLFSAASVALFFAHLFAFGVYGLSVVAYELWRTRMRWERPSLAVLRNWAITLAQFAAPIVLLAAGPLGERNTYIDYGDLVDKLRALVSPTLCYAGPIDWIIFAFLGILLVHGLFSCRLKVVEGLRFPLILLLLAAIVMPNWLLGVWGVDFRLPLVLACLVAAGARVELPNIRNGLALAAVGLVLFGARVWSISETWRGYDAQYSEFRQASRAIEPGARLLMVLTRREDRFDSPYWHLATAAVIERSVFLPTLFTDHTAQPVHVTKAYEAIDTPFGIPITPKLLRAAVDDPDIARMAGTRMPNGSRIYWANWPQTFDYVLYVHFGANDNPMPKLLRHVHAGSFFDIYKVVREQG
jgi:hypothetical protein